MRSLTNPPNRTLPLPAVLHPAPSSDANVCLPDGGFGERSSVDPQRGERVGRIVRCLVWALLLLAVAEYAWMARVFIARGAPHVNHVFLFWGWSKFIHVMSPVSGIYRRTRPVWFYAGAAGRAAVPPALRLSTVDASRDLAFGASAAGPGPLGLAWGEPCGLCLGVLAEALGAVDHDRRAAGSEHDRRHSRGADVAACGRVDDRRVPAGGKTPGSGGDIVRPVGHQAAIRRSGSGLRLLPQGNGGPVFVAGATVLVTIVASGVLFGWACWTRLPDAMMGIVATDRAASGDRSSFGRRRPRRCGCWGLVLISPTPRKSPRDRRRGCHLVLLPAGVRGAAGGGPDGRRVPRRRPMRSTTISRS